MPVTKDQAEMLATLTSAARPHGARRWDAAGVMAQIGKVRNLELSEVMLACARAARDRDLDTPGAIGNTTAPCWVERPVTRWEPEKTTPEQRCGECSQPRDICERTPRWADDDHTFRPDFKAPGGSAVDELRDIKAKSTTSDTPANATAAAGTENDERQAS